MTSLLLMCLCALAALTSADCPANPDDSCPTLENQDTIPSISLAETRRAFEAASNDPVLEEIKAEIKLEDIGSKEIAFPVVKHCCKPNGYECTTGTLPLHTLYHQGSWCSVVYPNNPYPMNTYCRRSVYRRLTRAATYNSPVSRDSLTGTPPPCPSSLPTDRLELVLYQAKRHCFQGCYKCLVKDSKCWTVGKCRPSKPVLKKLYIFCYKPKFYFDVIMYKLNTGCECEEE